MEKYIDGCWKDLPEMSLSAIPTITQPKVRKWKAKVQITEKMIWDVFPAVNRRRGSENKQKNIKGFVYTFNKYADYFGVDTKLEIRHFLAQLGHESDQFNAFLEYASGRAYEGRRDLGNTRKGDGARFRGRAGIQTTGRSNYKYTGREMAKLPFLTASERKLFENDGLLKNPKLLEDPVWGTLASFIYWTNKKDLNSLCKPDNQKVTIKRLSRRRGWYKYTCYPLEAITRKVNGGMNGYADREAKYKKLTRMIA